jgi:hypothetical protein
MYDWVVGNPWKPQGPDQLMAMPPDVRAAYESAAATYTFGVGFKRDENGVPIEMGIGSPGNTTAQSRAALAKFEAETARLKAAAGIKA